jgi:shikimate dehydrogenase
MNISDINGTTAFYAILADPVAQVSTPGLINQIFARQLANKVLIPLHVAADSLEEVVRGLQQIKNFRGAVITMPHKSSIVYLLDDASDEVTQTQSCNVIRRSREGKLYGHMLDGEGFVEGLRAEGHKVARKRVFLIGAGGAASGIAFALCKHDIQSLLIYNLSPGKAEALMRRLKAVYPQLEIGVADRVSTKPGLLINAKSVGMQEGDAPPLPLGRLDADTLVAEVIIRPEITCTLKEAVKNGCKIHEGIHMLKAQTRIILQFMNEDKASV